MAVSSISSCGGPRHRNDRPGNGARAVGDPECAPPPPQAYFGVQVGAFRNRDSAERLRQAMAAKYGRARLVARNDTPGLWHVVVGMEPTLEGASALSGRVVGENSSISAAFVVRLDSE